MKNKITPISYFKNICPDKIKWIFINGTVYGIGAGLVLYATNMFGKMVDTFSKNPQEIPYNLLILFTVSIVGYEVFYRIGHIIEMFVIKGPIRKTIKEDLFKKTMMQNYSYFVDRFAGGIAHRISNITNAFESIVSTFINGFIENILLLFFSFIILLNINVYLAFILIILSIFFILGLISISKKINKYSENFFDEENKTTSILSDIYINIGAVKVYSNNGNTNTDFEEQNKNEYNSFKKLGFYEILLFHYEGIFGIILLLSLLGGSYYLFFNGFLTLGDLVLVMGISLRIFWTIWEIGPNIANFIRNYGECQQGIFDILITPSFEDTKNPKTLGNSGDYSIEFKNIIFSYIGGKEVLKDFNLFIKPKEKIGIAGTSGSGKTTLINLLLRFYEVNKGSLLINNIDIKDLLQNELRSKITYVSQDTTLFHKTILENIKYSKNEASFEEIKNAGKIAEASDFIKMLPNSYDTMVGDRGVKLSGGQKQRIAIARAILKDSPIFLLDEATSALDSESESKVQESLHNLIDGKTVIAIAHRLSTLLLMDKIVVMSNGKIVESGTHLELLNKNGIYTKLWNMQSGGFIPEVDLLE